MHWTYVPFFFFLSVQGEKRLNQSCLIFFLVKICSPNPQPMMATPETTIRRGNWNCGEIHPTTAKPAQLLLGHGLIAFLATIPKDRTEEPTWDLLRHQFSVRFSLVGNEFLLQKVSSSLAPVWDKTELMEKRMSSDGETPQCEQGTVSWPWVGRGTVLCNTKAQCWQEPQHLRTTTDSGAVGHSRTVLFLSFLIRSTIGNAFYNCNSIYAYTNKYNK